MKRLGRLAVLCPVFASALGAATLNLAPSSLSVWTGSMFTLDVNVGDVTDLYAYQFDVGFDPALLHASGVTAGSFLASGGPTFFIEGIPDNPAGTVSATAESLMSAVLGVSGSGTLARVTFVAVSPGIASVSPFGVLLLDSSLAGIASTTGSSIVTISDVPEPSSGMLVGGGLLLLMAITARVGHRRRPVGVCR